MFLIDLRKIMKNLFFILVILGFFIACSDDQENKGENLNAQADSTPSFTQGDKLDFSLEMLNGDSLLIKADDGKVSFNTRNRATLFVFFTTWCAPCIAEIPHLNKLQEKYKDEFKIVGVLLEDKNSEELKNFSEKNKISYELANGENNYLFAKVLGGVNGIPAMFLYAKNGSLVNQYLGIIPSEMLEIEIQKALF